jgi:hypothetical protein
MDTPAADSPNMRVGDADRAEVADLLARHFADGRLDQAELDERLEAVMRAKTRADLLVVLADLPATSGSSFVPPPAAPVRQPVQRRRRRTLSPLPGLLLVVALVLLLGHLSFWLLAAALACLLLLCLRHRRA